MLHIVFTILKIPFVLLAVILLLLLLVMVLVSFVPVRYQVTAKKDGQLYAEGKITWLLRMITVLLEYSEKEIHFRIKLFGHPIIGEKSPKRTYRKKKETSELSENNPGNSGSDNSYPETGDQRNRQSDFELTKTRSKPEQTETPDDAGTPDEAENLYVTENPNDTETLKEPETEEGTDVPDKKDVSVDPYEREKTDLISQKAFGSGIFHKLLKLLQRIKALLSGLIERLKDINGTIQSFKSKADYYKRLWYDSHTQASWKHLKREIVYLLRHVRPKKANGWIRFGLDDPAATGQFLGLLCILQSLSGNHLIAEAEFDEKVFECNFQLKGHMRFCHFLKAALALLFDKHCRITFKRIRNLL